MQVGPHASGCMRRDHGESLAVERSRLRMILDFQPCGLPRLNARRNHAMRRMHVWIIAMHQAHNA
jgi:hypothetical protein